MEGFCSFLDSFLFILDNRSVVCWSLFEFLFYLFQLLGVIPFCSFLGQAQHPVSVSDMQCRGLGTKINYFVS